MLDTTVAVNYNYMPDTVVLVCYDYLLATIVAVYYNYLLITAIVVYYNSYVTFYHLYDQLQNSYNFLLQVTQFNIH